MKKLYLRNIICVVLYAVICIATLNFIFHFTQPQITNETADCFVLCSGSIACGAYTVGFLFVTGMFLFTISIKKTDWLLLLLIVSFAFLTINPLILPYNDHLLNASSINTLNSKAFQYIPSHAVLLYLMLKQDRQFWHYFLYNSRLTGIAVISAYVFSSIFGGNFSETINSSVAVCLNGQFNKLISWITILLLFTCTIVTLYCFIKEHASERVQENALDLKNDIISEIYGLLKDSMVVSNAMNQEFIADMNLLEEYARKGRYENLRNHLADMKRKAASYQQQNRCENPIIQQLLATYHSLAINSQIHFMIEAEIPEQMGTVECDFYTFLINLLNNAVEANQKITDPAKRFIHLKIHFERGFLSICCENPYTGVILTDAKGNFLTTKQTLHREALGIQQMKQIAAKYKSTLSIQKEEQLFVVQTAFRL